MKKTMFALVVGCAMLGSARDFYVDAESTAETPDGSQESPYKTLPQR